VSLFVETEGGKGLDNPKPAYLLNIHILPLLLLSNAKQYGTHQPPPSPTAAGLTY